LAASLNQLANVTIPTRRRLLQTGRWIPVAQLIGKHTVNKENYGNPVGLALVWKHCFEESEARGVVCHAYSSDLPNNESIERL